MKIKIYESEGILTHLVSRHDNVLEDKVLLDTQDLSDDLLRAEDRFHGTRYLKKIINIDGNITEKLKLLHAKTISLEDELVDKVSRYHLKTLSIYRGIIEEALSSKTVTELIDGLKSLYSALVSTDDGTIRGRMSREFMNSIRIFHRDIRLAMLKEHDISQAASRKVENQVIYDVWLDVPGSVYSGCSFRSDKLIIECDSVFKNCNFNCSEINLLDRFISDRSSQFIDCRLMGDVKLEYMELNSNGNWPFTRCSISDLKFENIKLPAKLEDIGLGIKCQDSCPRNLKNIRTGMPYTRMRSGHMDCIRKYYLFNYLYKTFPSVDISIGEFDYVGVFDCDEKVKSIYSGHVDLFEYYSLEDVPNEVSQIEFTGQYFVFKHRLLQKDFAMVPYVNSNNALRPKLIARTPFTYEDMSVIAEVFEKEDFDLPNWQEKKLGNFISSIKNSLVNINLDEIGQYPFNFKNSGVDEGFFMRILDLGYPRKELYVFCSSGKDESLYYGTQNQDDFEVFMTSDISPCGTKIANRHGLFDLIGNMPEASCNQLSPSNFEESKQAIGVYYNEGSLSLNERSIESLHAYAVRPCVNF